MNNPLDIADSLQDIADMEDWREHLNEAETLRLFAISREQSWLSKERRRIYDRCRKRMKRKEKQNDH